MALTYSNFQGAGMPAPDFHLEGIAPGGQVREFSLADFRDARALVVVFMCNHCPYVVAVQGRINVLAKEYAKRGVALVGINPNDSVRYPDDSFDAMKARAKEQGYVFPYLRDDTQLVAKAYGAVCTPDIYAFERVAEHSSASTENSGGQLLLRYQGRIDDSWKDESTVTRRDLAMALDQVLAGKPIDFEVKPSMGCSIKWKG